MPCTGSRLSSRLPASRMPRCAALRASRTKIRKTSRVKAKCGNQKSVMWAALRQPGFIEGQVLDKHVVPRIDQVIRAIGVTGEIGVFVIEVEIGRAHV